MDLTKGNIYQIRNRIACGFGTYFQRHGWEYSLSDRGWLKVVGSLDDSNIDYFDKDNWNLSG